MTISTRLKYLQEYTKALYDKFADVQGLLSLFASIIFVLGTYSADIPIQITISVFFLAFFYANYRSWVDLRKKLYGIEEIRTKFDIEKNLFVQYSCSDEMNKIQEAVRVNKERLHPKSSSGSSNLTHLGQTIAKAFESYNNLLGAPRYQDWLDYQNELGKYEKELKRFQEFIEKTYVFELKITANNYDENVKLVISSQDNVQFYDSKYDFPVEEPIFPSEPQSRISSLTNNSSNLISGITTVGQIRRQNEPYQETIENKLEAYFPVINGDDPNVIEGSCLHCNKDEFTLDVKIYSKNRGNKPEYAKLEFQRAASDVRQYNFKDD